MGRFELNDPRVSAALAAYWNNTPCGIKRRRRMCAALNAALDLDVLRPSPDSVRAIYNETTAAAIENTMSTPKSRAAKEIGR